MVTLAGLYNVVSRALPELPQLLTLRLLTKI